MIRRMSSSDEPLRFGWTTGACATAATRSAHRALVTGRFLDPVDIELPRGGTARFDLATATLGEGVATAGIVKDAGDDPDVTHGALILATVRPGPASSGTIFRAGEGVGIVTRPGLPVPVGEPAINPVPRAMMRAAVDDADVVVEIAIPGGAELAKKTWNPRLGIEGGLSILGTTGIVRPFSCSAWIASIHRGIDVARASGVRHAAASTGATSEAAVKALHGLPDHALLDMGDFIGGTLKYLRRHPIERLTLAGGFAKLTKFAQGALDLHSGRSRVDFALLAVMAGDPRLIACNTAMQALDVAGPALAQQVAEAACLRAVELLDGAAIAVEVIIVDRCGIVVARAAP
ncbi:MAG: cobalt-precorrin-5B (C(1))-methyltransferase [Geminicoccaceae bacterium]|nr:cobalt-precorrin-5B (C(1))-methyltransferase [Geminicoccaceae bacterium]